MLFLSNEELLTFMGNPLESKEISAMQHKKAYKFSGWLVISLAGAIPLTSCTTTSSLSALPNRSVKAVAQVVQEAPATEKITVGSPGSAQPATASPVAIGPVETLTAPPVDQLAQKKPAPSSAPIVLASVPRTPVGDRPTNQIMMVRTTAYSHLEADSLQYGRKSAAGNDLKYGSQVRSAAADWSKYPMGTRFMIEGLPYQYVVDDYGSALVGTETIDIYKPDMRTMGQWGVRNVPVKVLEWGSFEESRKILDGRKNVRHADHVRQMLREIERKGKSGYRTPSGVASV